MQKVSIKKRIINDNAVYYVQALSLKNSENRTAFLIPHPTGNEILEFHTLEEAVASVKKAGFDYILPDNENVSESVITDLTRTAKSDIENVLFNKFKSKTNDINSSVAVSALKALSCLNDKDAIDVFISKIGEDNDKIREVAIDALVSYKELVIDKLITALDDENWVTRNSAIIALTKICEYAEIEPEKILAPVMKKIDDKNTIVQSTALTASGQIYRLTVLRQAKK